MIAVARVARLGRHLRDLLSAPLMINNDRILTNTANLLLADRS
ncbi:hypothetical protein [Cupriavidus taiwanensis]